MNFSEPEVLFSDIIFKKIQPSDFNGSGYEASISYITPTNEGYISEQVKSAITFEEKNTVVVNAGVGQGKTHTILDIAKHYYEEQYIIVFAVPYKSLIDQYLQDLLGREIPVGDIVDYRNVTENPARIENEEISNPLSPSLGALKSIHLITVNSLLGNPGDEAIMQSDDKINYLNHLLAFAKSSERKVVFIYDEIHDSIHNFKQQYIFSLFKWHEVVHKNYCISATYNEASKIVIKYLALLTNKKIHIIESQRVKFEFKQSELFLLLYNKYHYNSKDDDLVAIFRYLISTGKRINILSYSKSIAQELAKEDGEIGKLLKDAYQHINLCVGDADTIFDPSKCNVGTTFSTGINIRGNDSAFVVLLPSKYSYEKQQLGVFSRGINTLIQALARIRDKSEIYIVTPSPKFLINFKNNVGENYTNKVKSIDTFNDVEVKDRYQDLNRQREIISEYYFKLKANVEDGIKFSQNMYSDNENNPSLNFPTLDDYILSEGENVLIKKFEIFGKDLSIYTFWAAFNDQFINCRLKGTAVLNELVLNENEVMRGLKKFAFEQFFEYTSSFNNYASEYFHLRSDKECFGALKEAIFSNRVILISAGKKKEIREKTKPTFIRYILALVQLIKKQNDYYNVLYYPHYTKYSTSISEPVDVEYDAKDYLAACFVNSERSDYSAETTSEEVQLISSYKVLYSYYKSFKERYIDQDKVGKSFFIKDISSLTISDDEYTALKESILHIKQNDELIKLKVISFFQGIDIKTSKEDLLSSVFRYFKKTFFTTIKNRVALNEEGDNRRDVVTSEFIIPTGKLLNLLFIPEDAWFEDIVSLNGIVESQVLSEDHPDKS